MPFALPHALPLQPHGEISLAKEVKEAPPRSPLSFRPQLAKYRRQRRVFSEILLRLVQADSIVLHGLNCSGVYLAVLVQIEVIDFFNGFL